MVALAMATQDMAVQRNMQTAVVAIAAVVAALLFAGRTAEAMLAAVVATVAVVAGAVGAIARPFSQQVAEMQKGMKTAVDEGVAAVKALQDRADAIHITVKFMEKRLETLMQEGMETSRHLVQIIEEYNGAICSWSTRWPQRMVLDAYAAWARALQAQ